MPRLLLFLEEEFCSRSFGIFGVVNVGLAPSPEVLPTCLFPPSTLGTRALAECCFPMPLPYPEVLQEGSHMDSETGCRKRGMNALVIVLNFLALGRPHRASSDMGVGRRLNKEQWEAVRRLEQFQEAWITVSPCGPEEMGRTAAKVESLEATLDDLELQAVSLSSKSSKYYHHLTSA